MTKKNILIGVVLLVVGIFVGQAMGYKTGFKKGDVAGYARAEADIRKLEESAAQKGVSEAAKAANPFQATNPLAGVESNPFEKAKKVLNPFQ